MGAKDNRRAKRLEVKGLRWHVQAMAASAIQREDGTTIAVNVIWDANDQEYGAVAFTVPGSVTSLEGVFDNHSHQTLGTFATEIEAKDACRKFAIEWLKSGDVAEACDCGPIEGSSDAVGSDFDASKPGLPWLP